LGKDPLHAAGSTNPSIESESFGNQGGIAPYDTRDVGKSANSNWFEIARHDKEASELGRKPHTYSSSRSSKVDDFGTN